MPSSYRYQLEKYRGVQARHDCPACGGQHRKTFTRMVDTVTGDRLPAHFGRCNRQDKCGYWLSPYHKPPGSEMSYAEEAYQDSLLKSPLLARRTRRIVPPLTPPVLTIPEDLVQRSLTGYRDNQLACLLTAHFGVAVAQNLLRQFEIGTSKHWPGACIFWLRDELGRVRGGQVVLFDENGHTVKNKRTDGTTQRCTSWVHIALAKKHRQRHESLPAWLEAYQAQAGDKSPCLFGLAQLKTVPFKQPLALVESPKTAVICAGFFPQFTWLAVNSLSYLTSSRLAPLKGRPVLLFPDASVGGKAFRLWQEKADALRPQGFNLSISDYLEQHASEDQKIAGLDLADVLLAGWLGYPPSWDDKEVVLFR